jgi:hypothetical protein
MSELQFLKNLRTDIDAKIAEIESKAPVVPVKWEPKGGRFMIRPDGKISEFDSETQYREFGVERETKEQAEHAAEWMRKFNRLMCWFEENAPVHQVTIEFSDECVSINFLDVSGAVDDLRTKIRDGIVEL